MASRILLAHLIRPRIFLLGNPFTPISIRDQMIRACRVADALFDERQELQLDNLPLLVVGAGAAGATLALRASDRGLGCVLVESAPIAFPLQSGCSTRWVDPSQYLWPSPGWDDGTFPFAGSPSPPLPWKADAASNIANDWLKTLYAHRHQLYLMPSTTVTSVASPSGGSISVHVATPFGPLPLPAGAVVMATGFGQERHVINGGASAYSGPPFWSKDTLQRPNLGAPGAVRVAISGGGDGALQDFVRIATGLDSARVLFQPIEAELPSDLFRDLVRAEEQAQRALPWCETELDECRVLTALEVVYDDSFARWKKSPSWPRVDLHVRSHLTQCPEMRLIHSCTHYAATFALNRIAVRLILECANGRAQRNMHNRVDSVQCRHANGGVGFSVCRGQRHDVSVIPWSCGNAAGSAASPLGSFEAVIVRNGIAPPTLRVAGTTNANVAWPRQILPFDLPC